MSDTATRLAVMEEKLDKVEASVEALQESVSANSVTLAGVKSDVDGLKSAVARIETNNGELLQQLVEQSGRNQTRILLLVGAVVSSLILVVIVGFVLIASVRGVSSHVQTPDGVRIDSSPTGQTSKP